LKFAKSEFCDHISGLLCVFRGISKGEADTVSVFRESDVPMGARPAGYAWLIEQLSLTLPLTRMLTAIEGQHRPRELSGWKLMPVRYEAAQTLGAQLQFALKWEGVDLPVLSAVFGTTDPTEVARIVAQTPGGTQTRRLWFLYEWLTDTRLALADAPKIKAVDAVDDKLQFALKEGKLSVRHRVRNNLPGTREFCPMVRRTSVLTEMTQRRLTDRVARVIGTVHPDVMARASAFLLLSDSRASFHIENEKPSRERTRRWAHSIAEAGTTPLSLGALAKLQREVIGDDRFVTLGLRTEGGFVGVHDRLRHEPMPDHISARHEDLTSLIRGLVAFDERAGHGALDAVIAAASIAFGFVYIHPFEDGNGRVHRWLLHHVFSASGFAPKGVVFPVSAVMLREIASYRRALESYSRPLLRCIEWRSTDTGNIEVLNESADLYRYFDATEHAEYLYACVLKTIDTDLPYEVAYLEAYDEFTLAVSALVDMPQRKLDLLHRFLRQNHGTLSQRASGDEFSALTVDEVRRVEALYARSVKRMPLAPDRTSVTEREREDVE